MADPEALYCGGDGASAHLGVQQPASGRAIQSARRASDISARSVLLSHYLTSALHSPLTADRNAAGPPSSALPLLSALARLAVTFADVPVRRDARVGDVNHSTVLGVSSAAAKALFLFRYRSHASRWATEAARVHLNLDLSARDRSETPADTRRRTHAH